MAQSNCNAGSVDTSSISEAIAGAHQAQKMVSEQIVDMHGSKVSSEAVQTALRDSLASLTAPRRIEK